MSEKTILECENEVKESRLRISGALKQLETKTAFSLEKCLATPPAPTTPYAYFFQCFAVGLYTGQLVAANQKDEDQHRAANTQHPGD